MSEMTTKESVWFDQGWAACEERIIKLLEERLFHAMEIAPRLYVEGQPLGPTEFIHSDNCFGCHQIALIKGEQK